MIKANNNNSNSSNGFDHHAFLRMIPASFYFVMARCCFDPADKPDDRMAKYSSYFC